MSAIFEGLIAKKLEAIRALTCILDVFTYLPDQDLPLPFLARSKASSTLPHWDWDIDRSPVSFDGRRPKDMQSSFRDWGQSFSVLSVVWLRLAVALYGGTLRTKEYENCNY